MERRVRILEAEREVDRVLCCVEEECGCSTGKVKKTD